MITIVMSTYNGAKYLEAQIESIINQTYKNWKLIIRDDGSKDESLQIINRYMILNTKIELAADKCGNIGITKSFESLLMRIESGIVFLCDQDDIWDPTKIESCLKLMKGKMLVQHDAILVDDRLFPIGLLSEHINFGSKIAEILLRPNFVGCCMCFDSRILKYVLPFPDGIAHDSWIGLIACIKGQLKYSLYPLIRFRRHSLSNSNVAKSNNSRYKKLTYWLIHMYYLIVRIFSFSVKTWRRRSGEPILR